MSMWRYLLFISSAILGSFTQAAEGGRSPEGNREVVYQGYVGTWQAVKVTAYSPHDGIDSHSKHSKDYVTADGTDWRKRPYGVAVPYRNGKPLLVSFGTQIIIPASSNYMPSRENRLFTCDDTGGTISRKTEVKRVPHIDIRFKTEYSAKKWARENSDELKIFVVRCKAEPGVTLDEAFIDLFGR